MSSEECIFCKIVNREQPADIIYETEHVLGFMDVNPLSEGHCLFIPKEHAEITNNANDEALSEILIAIKKVANAQGIEEYNILQNNGSIAHQVVPHAHFHLIPKPSKDKGLQIGWNPVEGANQEEIAEKIREELE